MLSAILGLLIAQGASQPVCLSKNIGQSSKDRVVAFVAMADAPTLRGKGFTQGQCASLIASPSRFAKETCRMASKSRPTHLSLVRTIYGVPAQSLCDGARLVQRAN